MPELPEVEHVRRYLDERVAGREILGVEHLDWKKSVQGLSLARFRDALTSARIADVGRRAKLVLIQLEDSRTLAVHLKMTGKLWVDEAARPPDRATRAIFALGPRRGERRSRPAWLRFEDQRKFGWMRLVSSDERDALLAPFGPDALEASEAALAAAYGARRGRAKPVLLDQEVVAGIGNIYADEILFRARVHPAARLEALPRDALRRLARETRAVMRDALALRGIEGGDDATVEVAVPDQKRVGSGARGVAARLAPRVYQRTGEPCLRCGAPITRIVLAGRATHLCETCQGEA